MTETSQKLTDFRVPEHGVFFVLNVFEELHDPVADVLYVTEIRLYGNSRYNVRFIPVKKSSKDPIF